MTTTISNITILARSRDEAVAELNRATFLVETLRSALKQRPNNEFVAEALASAEGLIEPLNDRCKWAHRALDAAIKLKEAR